MNRRYHFVPAAAYADRMAELNSHFGKTQAEIVKSIADGEIDTLERDKIRVHLRGLKSAVDDLLDELAPEKFNDKALEA